VTLARLEAFQNFYTDTVRLEAKKRAYESIKLDANIV
jgi:hypothetical protein